jgi:iron complex outermembrane recepter protein
MARRSCNGSRYSTVCCKAVLPGFIALLIILLLPFSSAAQFPSPDTLRLDLAEIEIQATRDTETEASAPFSVSVRTRSVSEQSSEPAFSFDQVAAGIPGLWVNDRQNYALGERVSIRGMGWRTAFGVRGIYVLLDDIPLTVPDGQTVMDILDPAMVRQIEVVRGPSSFFWGNAGGGTLFLSTRPATYDTSLRSRIYGGAYRNVQRTGAGHAREGPRGYHLNASWLQRDGYRDHSKHEVLRITGHMNWQLPPAGSCR